MSRFWQVEPELAEKIPSTMLDEVARFQMCEKVVVDFPGAWRKNVIERKSEGTLDRGGFPDNWEQQQPVPPSWIRVERALQDITHECEHNGVVEDEFLATLKSLAGNSVESIIVEACIENGVTPDDLLLELKQYQLSY